MLPTIKKVTQCVDCSYTFTGDFCPRCEAEKDITYYHSPVPMGNEAQEMLAWDTYYKRGFDE